jgi:hypothetical protein
MSKKRKPPKFNVGETVNVAGLEHSAVINKKPVWNGLTWMYSFENEELSCGEMYLSKAR